jgi:hypothetical protein
MTVGSRRVLRIIGGHEWGFDEPIPCECPGFTTEILPEGERLEFGKHRLPADEAETAPAWPPL